MKYRVFWSRFANGKVFIEESSHKTYIGALLKAFKVCLRDDLMSTIEIIKN